MFAIQCFRLLFVALVLDTINAKRLFGIQGMFSGRLCNDAVYYTEGVFVVLLRRLKNFQLFTITCFYTAVRWEDCLSKTNSHKRTQESHTNIQLFRETCSRYDEFDNIKSW